MQVELQELQGVVHNFETEIKWIAEGRDTRLNSCKQGWRRFGKNSGFIPRCRAQYSNRKIKLNSFKVWNFIKVAI